MAANVFRVILHDWKTCVRWSYGRRQLSQTQGPPDNPSFVESVDEYQFVERLLPLPKSQSHQNINIIPLLVVGSLPEIPFPACPTLFVALGCTTSLSIRRSHMATDR